MEEKDKTIDQIEEQTTENSSSTAIQQYPYSSTV